MKRAGGEGGDAGPPLAELLGEAGEAGADGAVEGRVPGGGAKTALRGTGWHLSSL